MGDFTIMKNIKLVLITLAFSCVVSSAFGAADGSGGGGVAATTGDTATKIIICENIPEAEYRQLFIVYNQIEDSSCENLPFRKYYIRTRLKLFPELARLFPCEGNDLTFEEKFIIHFAQLTKRPDRKSVV